MSNRRTGARALLVATVLSLTSCASGGSGGNPFGKDLAERGEIEIKVVNLNFSDATVWALIGGGGGRQRLGTVTGKGEEIFTLPWTFSQLLRIEFDLLAGPRCYTENLPVDPGDLLELQIASNAAADPSCR
jgi:hypothetical protein